MAISVQRYRVNDFNLYPFIGSVDSVTYYGYNTTFTASAAFEQQETLAATIHLYRDESTGKLSLHIILDAFQNTNTGSGVNVVVSGLPSIASITVQDDPSDSYTWTDSTTISATFGWGTCCTDGMVIDDIQDFTNIGVTINTTNGVDKFKLVASNKEFVYQPFTESNSITIQQTTEVLDSYLYLEPQPSVYSDPITISTVAGGDVQEVIYTTDGTSPALAKYLAYDNLDPPNPFIAVVEDGKGSVLFDGGFPKWYNSAWNNTWTVFSDMNARFKYLGNALEYISNPDKIAQGNKNILIVGDADAAQSYSVKSTTTNGFNTTFTEVCSIMGYTPTFKTKFDYGGNLDMSFAELDQYCALIVMSSVHTSAKFISDQCISNILTSREQGNGLLIVTDHGDNIASLSDAINTTYSGFFRTGNYIATNFGAYFTGNVNRTSVNVGFLRTQYGDHPLWNNIADTEDIYAGTSESSVVVPEVTTFSSTSIPLINLDQNGYHTYRYLLRLNDGSIVSESYTYGLNVSELVEILDDSANVINSLGPTNFRRITYDFNVIPGVLGTASGLIKKNNLVIGDFDHNGTELTQTYYTYDGKSPYIKMGDSIVVQITSPLEYIKTAQVLRNQRNLFDTLSYAKRIRYINRNEWASDISDYSTINTALSSINKVTEFDKHENMVKINNYMNDAERIPEATALIYDQQHQFDNAILSTVPPTPAQIFNEWGVFSISGQQFYETIADAPDVSPFNTWTYNETEDRVIQTANVGSYTGFVSSLPIENYVHETTLTSPNGDDDLIGVVIAHFWDGTKNHTLSALITMGGIGQFGANILSVVVDFLDGTEMIAQRSHDVVSANANSGTGWSGKQIRVKVEREGDIVKVLATKWDDVANYDPVSEIIIDLNTQASLSKFKGPMSYGYSTYSQASSTYIDINFTGGLNYNLITDAEQGVTNVYKGGTWEQIGSPMQVVYDFPRIVTNPNTDYSFLVTENDSKPYWGSANTVEVVGPRYVSDNNNSYEIVNYDETKSYTITTDVGTISNNGSTFTLNGLSAHTGEVSMTVSDGSDSINVNVQK